MQPEIDYVKIGRRIKAARLEKGYSQADLGALIGCSNNHMLQARKRTSMSVIEMGKRLGLGKTESYWLIKKNYFQTIMVGKKMRVMIASFEDWYANQCRYHKIDGRTSHQSRIQ